MIIMICGKGGCGKSTISALLARTYAKQNRRVLVVDADESNFGLHRQLGCELPVELASWCGGRSGIFSTPKGAEDVRQELFGSRWTIEDIPSECISETDGVKLAVIGKIHEAGEGCACAMGVLAKNFLPNLILKEDDVVIIDAEAGVEHFGRGVDHKVDRILMVADPSFESIQLSEKIMGMADALGKKAGIVLNKTDAQKADMMRQAMASPERILAVLNENTEVLLQGLKGEKLTCEIPEIRDLAEKLMM